MDFTALKNELVNDPETLGYSGVTDFLDVASAEADATLISAVNRPVDIQTLSASQLFEAIDQAEWAGRTADQKDDIRLVLGLGDNIQIAPGTKARDILANALSGATASLANLGALGTKNVSRGEELGLGVVGANHVQAARKLG